MVKGRRYRIELREEQPWFDGSHATNPLGLRARDMGVVGILGSPFRRVIEANYLQPIVEIRKPPSGWRFDSLHMFAPPLRLLEPCLYAVEFTADHDGELFVFANDAVSLHDPAFFYRSQPGAEPRHRRAQHRAARERAGVHGRAAARRSVGSMAAAGLICSKGAGMNLREPVRRTGCERWTATLQKTVRAMTRAARAVLASRQ